MKCSYILVSFSKLDKLIPAVQALSEHAAVIEWNAVEGYVNLVIKVEGQYSSVVDQIKSIEGFERLFVYDVVEECRQPKTRNADWNYAYIFLEAERTKRDSLRKLLGNWESVHCCELTVGGCDFVVLVGAETIGQIDASIRRKLSNADGILRMKRVDVINLIKI